MLYINPGNVQQGIQIEQLYLQKKAMNQNQDNDLASMLLKIGYSSLEDYFNDKNIYLFNQLIFNYQIVNQYNCLPQALIAMESNQNKLLTSITEHQFVFAGNEAIFNKQYCEDNNIPICYTGAGGGTIVSSPGDLTLAICFTKSLDLKSEYFLQKIQKILSNYSFLEVTIDNNDILIDGKKVGGSTMFSQNKTQMFVIHLSFSNNDNISKICEKNSFKQPSYINFITPSIIIEEVQKWLHLQLI